MSFKVHLIIICSIIVATYLAIQVIGKREKKPAKVVEKSAYSIQLLHASWALNCNYTLDSWEEPKHSTFANDPEQIGLREDNVFQKVYDLCHGKERCTFKVGPEALGKDPAPRCGDKEIKIEYRCFDIDRPWIIQSRDKEISIDCVEQNANKSG
ncbi:MAG: hypothetical protein AB7L92_07190 [Alphaproteobacteria bacterium]